MTRGAYHSPTTPDGRIIRQGGGNDGRYLKRKNREVPYYVRLTAGVFDYLESLLDVPWNRDAGTAVRGCASRADLIEASFLVFGRINAFAREMNTSDTDLLVTKMIEAVRELETKTVSPAPLTVETPIAALPAPRNSNS